jgi:hypothetical protein
MKTTHPGGHIDTAVAWSVDYTHSSALADRLGWTKRDSFGPPLIIGGRDTSIRLTDLMTNACKSLQ